MTDETRKWVRTTGWLAAQLGRNTMPRAVGKKLLRYSINASLYVVWQNSCFLKTLTEKKLKVKANSSGSSFVTMNLFLK